MSRSRDWDDDVAVFRAPDGRLVVEADLTKAERPPLSQLITAARATGADAIWAHGVAVDAALGFRRCGGYARLEAAMRPVPVELPRVPLSLVRELQIACYGGVWGHHDPGEPDPTSTFVGLVEAGQWLGICEYDATGDWIDGPGVLPHLRTPDRYARLVGGAATYLNGPRVTLESWGDSDETLDAYRRLGFVLVEYVPGWELGLGKV
jgi:hypothetical protein